MPGLDSSLVQSVYYSVEGVSMAEEEQKEGGAAPVAETKKDKPVLLMVLLVVNIFALVGVGAMLYLNSKKADEKASFEKVAKGEKETQEKEAAQEEEYIGQRVPLETFLVNLAGVRGGKLMKITMSLEVENEDVQDEVYKRKPQIRDIILILLSSKTYDQVSSKEGKDFLRDEIRDTVNSFLTKGSVKRVLFTEFFYN